MDAVDHDDLGLKKRTGAASDALGAVTQATRETDPEARRPVTFDRPRPAGTTAAVSGSAGVQPRAIGGIAATRPRFVAPAPAQVLSLLLPGEDLLAAHLVQRALVRLRHRAIRGARARAGAVAGACPGGTDRERGSDGDDAVADEGE